MADQKRWFKVWVSLTNDPAFLSLPLDALGRWTLLGAWMAEHGDRGTLKARESAIRHVLRLGENDNAECALNALPNVSVRRDENDNDEFTVIISRWAKYQEDSSTYERLKRHRQKQNDNGLRGEEKRGEKKRREESVVHAPDAPAAGASPDGFSAWPEEWNPIRNLVTGPQALPFLASYQTWVADLPWWHTLRAHFAPLPIATLVTDAVAYIEGEGYHPRTKAALRQKLRNCMEFAAKKLERRTSGPATYPREDPYAKFPILHPQSGGGGRG